MDICHKTGANGSLHQDKVRVRGYKSNYVAAKQLFLLVLGFFSGILVCHNYLFMGYVLRSPNPEIIKCNGHADWPKANLSVNIMQSTLPVSESKVLVENSTLPAQSDSRVPREDQPKMEMNVESFIRRANKQITTYNLNQQEIYRAKYQIKFNSSFDVFKHKQPVVKNYLDQFGELPADYDPSRDMLYIDRYVEEQLNSVGYSNISMLFLCSKIAYDFIVTREYWDLLDVAVKHPLIGTVTMYGMGFDGWKNDLNILENLDIHFGHSHKFDMVIVHITPGFTGIEPANLQERGLIHNAEELKEYVANKKSILCMRLWECWTKRCNPWIQTYNPDIISMAVPEEMNGYEDFATRRLIFHMPMNVKQSLFYKPASDADRDIDLLLVGANTAHYPLRNVFAKLISSSLISGRIVEHPGYGDMMNYVSSDRSYITMQNQMREYANLLKRSKMVVCTSSYYGYAVRKYHEIPIAGALVIGNIPNERQDFFRQFVVEVKKKDQDYIINLCNEWLNNTEKRVWRASIGQTLTLRNFREEQLFDLLLKAFVRFKRGNFGLWWPYDYSRTCRNEMRYVICHFLDNLNQPNAKTLQKQQKRW